MKAMTKQDLADKAGISLQTLRRWCKPLNSQLTEMGVRRKTKLLPPKAVKLICEYFCIDVD